MCTGNCNDEPNINLIVGQKGADGNNGWTPTLSTELISGKTVLKVTGWTGGTGTPPASNVYIYPGGYTPDSSLATDFTGPAGPTGSAGSTGSAGWTPVPAIIVDPNDSTREVVQIVDWTGGGGSKPSTTNQYIGSTGIVNTIAAASNVKGATGPQGPAGVSLPDPTGQNGKFLGVSSSAYLLQTLPSQFPAISSNTKRVLREKADGTGVEWYSPFSSYVRIPITSSFITSSTTVFTTIRDASSSNYLKATLPNDGTVRKLKITCTLIALSSSPDGGNGFCHFGIRDITNNISLTDEQIYTYYRPTIVLEYYGTITCSGQDIGMQIKHDSGQYATNYLGGTITVTEFV